MLRALPRALIAVITLFIELTILMILYYFITSKFEFIDIIYSFFCLYIIFKIIKDSKSYSYTLPWIIIFMIIPIPGSIIYLTIKFNLKINKFIKNITREEKSLLDMVPRIRFVIENHITLKEAVDNFKSRLID